MLKAFSCPWETILTHGSKVPPKNLRQITNSFNLHLEYIKSFPIPNGLTQLPASHGSERLLKIAFYLLEHLDFKIRMYVNLGGQEAGRREKEGSPTNNVLVNIYMSVKFFSFYDKHGYME